MSEVHLQNRLHISFKQIVVFTFYVLVVSNEVEFFHTLRTNNDKKNDIYTRGGLRLRLSAWITEQYCRRS